MTERVVVVQEKPSHSLSQISRESSNHHHAATGRVHYRTLDKAVKRFKEADSEDARLLVASGIKVQKWLDGALSEHHRGVCNEVEFSDDALDESTTGNLYALKTRSQNKLRRFIAWVLPFQIIQSVNGQMSLCWHQDSAATWFFWKSSAA